jgi:hypothetical protein
MDVLLNKTYSFNEKAKNITPCTQECGNKFKLVQVTVETAPFPQGRDIRFRFLCECCGREVGLNLIVDEDKVRPIIDQGCVKGIHFSFFANIPLNFDYANEEVESFSSRSIKERKKSINPNRIFRDRKGKSFGSFQYTRPPAGEMNAFETRLIPKESGWVRSKDEEEMVWKEGKAINWETTKLDCAEQPIAQSKSLLFRSLILSKIGKGVIPPEKPVEQEMNGDGHGDLEYDEFFDYDDYDDDTSTR